MLSPIHPSPPKETSAWELCANIGKDKRMVKLNANFFGIAMY